MLNDEFMNMKKKRHSSFSIHRSAFSQGFTLIEIMLVVVIILIATSIAIPTFRGTFKSTQMTDAVRSTTRMARFARSLAILKQNECTLSFEEDQMILTCSDPGEPKTVRHYPRDIRISDFENKAEHSPASGGRIVRYYSNGMNDGFELTLSDDRNRHQTIECHPISGKVTVKP